MNLLIDEIEGIQTIDEIEEIHTIEPSTGKKLEKHDNLALFPANLFISSKDRQLNAIFEIQADLVKQSDFFRENGKPLEAKRLEDRVTFDLEMIRELGYCSGIENYSRYFDGRKQGARPFCLLDYFPDDYLLVIDEGQRISDLVIGIHMSFPAFNFFILYFSNKRFSQEVKSIILRRRNNGENSLNNLYT